MKWIDLRSDTVTRPTAEMRKAMYQAEVADDLLDGDPTVQRLERLAADLLGKEEALFVSSGTMGNLVALLTHCRRGDKAIIGSKSHMFLFERGGISVLGGIMAHVLPNQPDGTLLLAEIEDVVRSTLSLYQPPLSLVCLENTHNACSGTPLTSSYTDQVGELTRSAALRLHLDGARIFNAAAALGVDVLELVRGVDSVMFCLSKGLCAPMGSLLCGTAAFIAEARQMRQLVGGGLRQAGVLAAAGIVALDEMTKRLVEDHDRAKRLAEGLAELQHVEVEPVPTNMVFFKLAEGAESSSDKLVQALADERILIMGSGVYGRFRAVTHYGICDQDIEKAITAIHRILGRQRA